MPSIRLVSCALLATVTLAASGCDQFRSKPTPQTGSLTQHLMMVDTEGKNYGVVELDPINGGKVYDAQGRLIGRVVSPGPELLAPTVVGAPPQ